MNMEEKTWQKKSFWRVQDVYKRQGGDCTQPEQLTDRLIHTFAQTEIIGIYNKETFIHSVSFPGTAGLFAA